MTMFPIIDVSAHASAHARGLAYGRAARPQVAQSISTYMQLFAACGVGWPEAVARARRFQPAIDALDSSLSDEVRGIAEGSEQPLDAILALNCRTEILPASILDANLSDASECTAMCVAPEASANGHAWFAQNWDWLGQQREALVVLKTRDDRGRRIITLTEAGMLAKIGLNDAGFALGLNIVRSRNDGERPGVPVHALLRHLLSCASIAEARVRLRAIEAIGFGSSSNVPCADAVGEVACFEVAPAGWAELRPANGVVVHTNHFLCEALVPHQAPVGAAVSSGSRLETARQHAATPHIGLPELQAFLRDASDGYLSICRSPNPDWPAESRMESVAGIVIDAHARQMWIAPDVPSRVPFQWVA